MGLFTGKRGIIMGIANEYSLATSVAKFLVQEGAEIGVSHLPDKPEGPAKMLQRVKRVTDPLGVKFVRPCDVTTDSDITRFFSDAKEHFGNIDFLVHSIAFAPIEDIRCPTIDASRNGFKLAMDISVYSFIAASREAAKIMTRGGSIATMTYYGGERVIGGYNLMGVCKSALESAMKYVAFDLGPKGIRVNAISAGPVETLASSAVSDFSDMLKLYEMISPLQRNIESNEVGKTTGYILSDLASATTGEILHVDCGFHVMAGLGHHRNSL